MITKPKDKILVSFSGGETSGFMLYYLLKYFPNKEYKFVFANTGEENEETLLFVKKCQEFFNIDLAWVEYKELSFKIVDYYSAYRSHSTNALNTRFIAHPFRNYIAKFGVPNMQNMTCTRELKERPITRYLSSIGWTTSKYDIALGIRADEPSRIKKHWYPLFLEDIDKRMVNAFWEKMPFRLELKGYQGNCKTCWKKSDSKLKAIHNETPYKFDFFTEMEVGYENYVRETQKHRIKLPVRFFRKMKTVEDISNVKTKRVIDDSLDVSFQTSIINEKLITECIGSCEPFN